ncbi:MAG: hypothetical protein L6R40_000104 [Gallowayella cf. fulva]|nr:MAG: hypothetical protein L6R40_000104 [Xanthomendoza cf. fulva]
MSIAFAVNAGPLAQIGLEIASLPTAYQLATGAYGWFKARERSKSLQELVSVSGGQLVSTSSFSFTLYKSTRTDHTSMQGVVVQDQKVQRTALPRGSTAIPEHSGLACLRAITTGLLVLHKTEAIVEILQDLIPFALVQMNQADTSLEIEGALLSSLKQWVSTVALEEDSDMFRKFLLETVTARRSRMTGVHIDNILEMDHTSVNEIPLVIGVLRWILTPAHKRDPMNYPTRSLRVWTVASLMEVLGFEIQADAVVVQSIREYESGLQISRRFADNPRVFLVVFNSEETDPTPMMHIPRASDSPKPQITMIRGIPWIMFRELRGSRDEIDTQYLADIWNMSFRNAKACFRRITMVQQSIKIEIQEDGDMGVPEHQKSLMSDFSPEFDRICRTVMRHYISMSPSSPGWDPYEIKEQMRTLREDEGCAGAKSPCKDSCYILYAIVCGAVYGLCSNACLDNGNVLSEDSEVAFAPDLLFQDGGRKLKEWAHIIGHCMTRNQVPLTTWSDLLFEVFLGKEDTSSASLKSMNAPSSTNYSNRQNPHPHRLLLGAQSNGLIAVADILVRLTTRKESFCYFHIARGQILSFPLTEDYYIQASTYMEAASILALDPEPNNCVLHRFDDTSSYSAMRVDVEPCWAGDPRTVLFVLRSHGVPIATMNILAFIDRLSFDSVECRCQTPSWEVPVKAAERWQLVTLYQLMRTRFKGMSFKRVDVSFAATKVLLDGSQSVAASIYAICHVHSKHLSVATECLACAYAHVMRNWQKSDAIIVITC